MSKYTTELKNIIDNGYSLGLDKYPIFDELYRPVLNQKIIEHYYFHEIGFETYERFKYELNVVMNEIMYKYNKLYLAEQGITDILSSYKSERDSSALSDNESINIGNDVAVFYDTPSGSLGDITDSTRATNVSKDIQDNQNNSSGSNLVNSNDKGTNELQHVLLEQLSQLTISIDLMVIADLHELFMMIY